MTFTWQLNGIDQFGQKRTPPSVPAALAVTSGTYLGSASASGFQVYTLNLDHIWVFTRPEATLYIPNEDNVEGTVEAGLHFGVLTGTGYAPNWRQTHNPGDNSQIQAKKLAESPSSDPTKTIPWLKLEVTAHSGSGTVNAGKGVFGGTSFIQRINTDGGVAPSGAQPGIPPGAQLWMPYTAVYAFWGAVVSSTGGL